MSLGFVIKHWLLVCYKIFLGGWGSQVTIIKEAKPETEIFSRAGPICANRFTLTIAPSASNSRAPTNTLNLALTNQNCFSARLLVVL